MSLPLPSCCLPARTMTKTKKVGVAHEKATRCKGIEDIGQVQDDRRQQEGFLKKVGLTVGAGEATDCYTLTFFHVGH